MLRKVAPENLVGRVVFCIDAGCHAEQLLTESSESASGTGVN